MAPCAVWSGQLRLPLVTTPVEIHAATTSGSRLREGKTVEGMGPVEREDIVKGYETGDGDDVPIDSDERKDLELKTSRRLEIVQVVEQGEIAPLRCDRPRYAVPGDEPAEDAYRVVRDGPSRGLGGRKAS